MRPTPWVVVDYISRLARKIGRFIISRVLKRVIVMRLPSDTILVSYNDVHGLAGELAKYTQRLRSTLCKVGFFANCYLSLAPGYVGYL